jgi:hypothetical protein
LSKLLLPKKASTFQVLPVTVSAPNAPASFMIVCLAQWPIPTKILKVTSGGLDGLCGFAKQPSKLHALPEI